MLLLLAAALVSGADPRPATDPCAASSRHALDFWIGRWTTTDEQGQKAESVVEPIVGGCAILERFTGVGARFIGAGIHTAEDSGAGWKQYWVDNRGVTLVMTGTVQGTTMRYDWTIPVRGTPTPQRYDVEPRPDGTVVQTGFTTKDGGRTWAPAWVLTYRKAAT